MNDPVVILKRRKFRKECVEHGICPDCGTNLVLHSRGCASYACGDLAFKCTLCKVRYTVDKDTVVRNTRYDRGMPI